MPVNEPDDFAVALKDAAHRLEHVANRDAQRLASRPLRHQRDDHWIVSVVKDHVFFAWKIVEESAGRYLDSGRDLLSMLMAVKDEETGETMSDRQLRDEVMTLVLAGHETTANALSWTFYLL